MFAIELIPVNAVIPSEDIVARINSGWVLMGQVATMIGNSVVTPDNPNGQQPGLVNVWVLPEPMLPMGQLFEQILVMDDAFQEGVLSSKAIMDGFAIEAFGMTVEQMREQKENAERQARSAGESDPAAHPVVPSSDWVPG